jgi:hypothetical protein
MKRCEDCLHLPVCDGLYMNLDTKCDRNCGYFKKRSDYVERKQETVICPYCGTKMIRCDRNEKL